MAAFILPFWHIERVKKIDFCSSNSHTICRRIFMTTERTQLNIIIVLRTLMQYCPILQWPIKRTKLLTMVFLFFFVFNNLTTHLYPKLVFHHFWFFGSSRSFSTRSLHSAVLDSWVSPRIVWLPHCIH